MHVQAPHAAVRSRTRHVARHSRRPPRHDRIETSLLHRSPPRGKSCPGPVREGSCSKTDESCRVRAVGEFSNAWPRLGPCRHRGRRLVGLAGPAESDTVPGLEARPRVIKTNVGCESARSSSWNVLLFSSVTESHPPRS